MEIIPIIKEIVKYTPNVKLNILGEADSKEFDLDKFKSEIKNNSLDNNINIYRHSLNVQSFYKKAE